MAEYKQLLSIKGAAFTSACISVCQEGPLDMLMYYDARPTVFNNLFDPDFYEPRKGYYVIKLWGEFLKNGAMQCDVKHSIPDLYVTAAEYGNEKITVITYYTDKNDMSEKDIEIRFDDDTNEKALYLLDENNDMADIATVSPLDGKYKLNIKPNTVVVLR